MARSLSWILEQAIGAESFQLVIQAKMVFRHFPHLGKVPLLFLIVRRSSVQIKVWLPTLLSLEVRMNLVNISGKFGS